MAARALGLKGTLARWRRRNPPGKVVAYFFLYLVVTAGAVTMLLPFLWALSTSLKMPPEIYTKVPGFLPKSFRWDNYRVALRIADIWRPMRNTTIVTVAGTFGNLLVSSMAAYVLARKSFPGARFFLFFFIGTLMISDQVLLVPTYLVERKLHLLDSLAGITLPKLAWGFIVFLLVGFFRGFPKEIEDAATIDGCSELRFFFTILLPLSRPALVASAIFLSVAIWNDFMLPLMVISSDHNLTVQLMLAQKNTVWVSLDQTIHLGHRMALTLVTMLPILAIFAFFQRYFVKGITLGALKG